MILAVVKGNVVSTNKTEKLSGGKLLIIEEWNLETKVASGRPMVALDLVGAGTGELVLCVGGSSARQTQETEKRPVDLAIIGIVDQAELNGETCYRKYPHAEVAPESEPKAAVPAPEPAPAAKAEPEPKAAVPEPEPAPEPEPVEPVYVMPEPMPVLKVVEPKPGAKPIESRPGRNPVDQPPRIPRQAASPTEARLIAKAQPGAEKSPKAKHPKE